MPVAAVGIRVQPGMWLCSHRGTVEAHSHLTTAQMLQLQCMLSILQTIGSLSATGLLGASILSVHLGLRVWS